MKQPEIGSVCPAFAAVTEQQEEGVVGGRTVVVGTKWVAELQRGGRYRGTVAIRTHVISGMGEKEGGN